MPFDGKNKNINLTRKLNKNQLTVPVPTWMVTWACVVPLGNVAPNSAWTSSGVPPAFKMAWARSACSYNKSNLAKPLTRLLKTHFCSSGNMTSSMLPQMIFPIETFPAFEADFRFFTRVYDEMQV